MFLPRHNTPRLYCKAPPAKAALSVADKVDAHTTMFSRYGATCVASWKWVLCWQRNAADGIQLPTSGLSSYAIGV